MRLFLVATVALALAVFVNALPEPIPGGEYMLFDGTLLQMPYYMRLKYMTEPYTLIPYNDDVKKLFDDAGYIPIFYEIVQMAMTLTEESGSQSARASRRLQILQRPAPPPTTTYVMAIFMISEYDSSDGNLPAGMIEISVGFMTEGKNDSFFARTAMPVDYGTLFYVPMWMTEPFFSHHQYPSRINPKNMWTDLFGLPGYTKADITYTYVNQKLELYVKNPRNTGEIWAHLHYDTLGDSYDPYVEGTFRSGSPSPTHKTLPWKFIASKQITHVFNYTIGDGFEFPVITPVNRKFSDMITIATYNQDPDSDDYFFIGGPLSFQPSAQSVSNIPTTLSKRYPRLS